MNPYAPVAVHARGSRLGRSVAAHPIVSRLALTALVVSAALMQSGCRVVEAIFKVGVWFGVLVVVTIVAVIGGIAAMVMKRS